MKQLTSNPNLTDLLTVKQVAEITNYSVEHIRRLIREDKLEADRPGHKYFISRTALNNYIKGIGPSKEERIRMRAREDAAQDSAPTSEELAALRTPLS